MARSEFQERIGVGAPSYALQRTGPTRRKPVIGDEGPRRGTVVGVETEHKSGRQDATVFAPAHHQKRGAARDA